MVKIKNRNDVLKDVIKDGKKAVVGKDKTLQSNDCYIMNPNTGIYLLKEYSKNPYVVKGVGGQIARHVDEEIDAQISKYAGDFGIMQGDFEKILRNLERGVQPKKIYDSAIKGKKDMGLKIPVRGKASNSEETLNLMNNELSKEKKKLDRRFEKIASEDGFYSSYD